MKVFNSLCGLRQHKKTLSLIFVVSVSAVLLSSAVAVWLSCFHNLTLPSIGTIKTVGVEAYADQNCKNKIQTIDWGTIWLGSTQNVTLYLRSISNVKTFLHLSASSIIPADISDYINLSWNYDGSPLNPGEKIAVTLFLAPSTDYLFIQYLVANEMSDFHLDIHIIAYE